MRILIVTHAPRDSTKGNRITAERWSRFLTGAGHEVSILDHVPSGTFDCLIALHATFASQWIQLFRTNNPTAKTIVCLTGTDLHLDLQGNRGEEAQTLARHAIDSCDQLVLLEPEGLKNLPEAVRTKSVVILQSAARLPENQRRSLSKISFELVLIGHLREEKDPFLAALAACRLPETSRIRILHLGAALSEDMNVQAKDAMKASVRYRWLGPLSHQETQIRLAASRAMLLTSRIEGAPSVISEAIVNRVPILATRIPATVGLLGKDYPGLFDIGDDKALCELMVRIESEPNFLTELSAAIEHLACKFSPDTERDAIVALLPKS